MATPYQAAARDYWEAGWSPLPLPAASKAPVPVGFTGATGKYVTEKQLDEWLAEGAKAKAGKLSFKPANVALRLPRNVLGVDVDAYGEKAGEATLAAAEEEWGPLPRTWVSTSRDDGLSGIRFFRIPEGLAWPGQLPQGLGVELLRWDHRFAIVAPSVHDITRASYRWLEEKFAGPIGDRAVVLEESDSFPEIADLPALPKRWVEGLTKGEKWKERAVDDEMDAGDLRAWLLARNAPDTPCAAMRKTVTDYARALRKSGDDGGAHDSARDAAWAVLGDAAGGHSGVSKALAELRQIFLNSVAGRRTDAGAARAEWARIVLRGAAKVSAEGDAEELDPCESIGTLKKASGRRGLSWAPLDELGNASRLVETMAGRARWVEAWNNWAIWDDIDRIWRPDDDRQVERWAVKAISEIEDEIKHLTDEKAVKAYKAHIKSSLNVGKQQAMIQMARARRGIIVPASTFDSRPELLGVGNGVIELLDSGAKLRPATQNDFLTLRTNTKFIPKAKHKLWSGFLRKFLPDVEIRSWLQRLVGYSLLGDNPARLLIFVVGTTSTGKTTFAEALRETLGGLAGPIPVSVFRDNADDKPRPDLLDALPKRLVISEELSAAQHLHTDQIKRLTGGSLISARGMRSNRYAHAQPAFTPWLVTNAVPTITGADVALYRRLIVVPFEVHMPPEKEDPTYRRRLMLEGREAILAWALEGYNAYASDPRSISRIPAGAVQAFADVRDDMSELDVFIAERCNRVPEARVIPKELYNEYVMWCEENNIGNRDRVSGTKFGRELTAKGFYKKTFKVDGRPVWFRVGITLRGSGDE